MKTLILYQAMLLNLKNKTISGGLTKDENVKTTQNYKTWRFKAWFLVYALNWVYWWFTKWNKVILGLQGTLNARIYGPN